MQPFVVRREITSCSCGEPGLSVYLHSRPEAVTVAARPAQSDGEPMQFSSIIYEYLRTAAQFGCDRVHPSVIVEVAERRTTSCNRNCAARVRLLEPAVAIEREQRRFQVMERRIQLFDIVHDVALHNKQVFPAVVIEILQSHTPARSRAGENTQACL